MAEAVGVRPTTGPAVGAVGVDAVEATIFPATASDCGAIAYSSLFC